MHVSLKQEFYIRRFPTSSEGSMDSEPMALPNSNPQGAFSRDQGHSSSGRKPRAQTTALSIQTLRRSSDCAALFRSRILQPMPMDRLQVLWKGRFKTKDDEVIYALSWWAADVLARKGRTYRIRYPGWGARWVEDVSLSYTFQPWGALI